MVVGWMEVVGGMHVGLSQEGWSHVGDAGAFLECKVTQ